MRHTQLIPLKSFTFNYGKCCSLLKHNKINGQKRANDFDNDEKRHTQPILIIRQ